MLLALAGYVVADAADVVPGPLTTSDPIPDPAPFPTVTAVPAERRVPDLDPQAPLPSAQELTEISQRLAEDPRTGGSVAVVIHDVLTGQGLVDIDGETPRTPASSLKLLVALAALHAYGPEHQLQTTVVAGGSDRLVLVGGGDILLDSDSSGDASDDDDADSDDADGGATDATARASLADLASQTADALDVGGPVTLAVDDSLFTGPRYAAGWGGIDLDYVMPIGPLAVDAGADPGGGYLADPALAAGETFAAALREVGVEVTGDVERATAPADGQQLAEVSSAPLAAVVAHMLEVSDNSLAEVLARLVALAAGEEPSFAGGRRAVVAQLEELEVPTEDLTLADTAGLLLENRVPATTLAHAVQTAADPDRPDLHAAIAGLPIGGLEGTLRNRMTGGAAGVLRAKTGTLITAASLTGVILDADGRLLAFSILADELEPGGAREARAAIDDWAEEIAACGCR